MLPRNLLLRFLLFVLLIPALLARPLAADTWTHERGTLTLEEPPERIVALNWAATETLLLLGRPPVGIADLEGYKAWVKAPELPQGIANVGTRIAPSLEAIAELKPDLIVTSTEMAPAANLLERIAPTYVLSVYSEGSRPYPKARELLVTLGDMLGRRQQADKVLADIDQALSVQKQRLNQAGLTGQRVALVSFLGDRHVRLYTHNGLYQTALDSLGLVNAWPATGNFWGFSVVGLEAIAPYGDSRVVVISPTLPGLSETLANSPFWTYLPAVQQRLVYQIDPVWPFGGVFQVQRLAELLTNALLAGGDNNVR